MDLQKLSGKIPADALSSLSEAMDKFQINTSLRAAHFIAQAMHESTNFAHLVENLNYSGDGLKKIFGKYFPDNLADSYARQPQKIASRVYASRMGNGDEASQEGWKFRGRGYIQLTGKSNYQALGKAIGEDLIANPDLVSTPKYAALSAAWFFSSHGLNEKADTGATHEVVAVVTKGVNGGTLGLAEREHNFNMIYALLNA